jgi:MFS transporter, DHA1 family, tetracycline resistance protein
MDKKVLPILFVTLLLDTIGFGMVFPILPIIFTDPSSPSFLLTGYSQSSQFLIAGAVTAIFGLTQFIAAPILGELSDMFGRKRLLTIGVGVLAFSQFMFGFGIEIASLGLLFFARAIAGIAAANLSVAQASIADVTTPENRAKNFGLIGGAFGIGFIIGPLLGGWLSGISQNPSLPFWTACFLGIINVLFISLFLPETNPEKKEVKSFPLLKGFHNIQAAFQDKEARRLYLTSFLYMAGFAFFTSFIGILLVSLFHFSETQVGTFFAVVGFFIVITQMVILRILASKFKEKQILRFSMVMVSIVMMFYPFLPDGRLIYFLIPLLAIPQGLTMANIPALVSKSVSPKRQGAALGINGSLLALAQGIIPLIAGVGSGIIGVQLPFIAGGILIFAAWSVLFLFSKNN